MLKDKKKIKIKNKNKENEMKNEVLDEQSDDAQTLTEETRPTRTHFLFVSI